MTISNKGNVTIATVISAAIAVGGYITTIAAVADDTAKLNDDRIVTLQRLSVEETKSEQFEKIITTLNSKMDLLLKAQGYTEATIERLNSQLK